MAEQYNMSADNIKQALGGLDTLKADLKVRKAVEFLVENSKSVA
jgi:trigger factor